MSEKMKAKVAEAIKKRGEAKVKHAAEQLKEAVSLFMKNAAYPYGGYSNKLTAEILRNLANKLDGTSEKWGIPKEVWDAANQRAYEEFMNQFDALTRFVNQGIGEIDSDCSNPEEECPI